MMIDLQRRKETNDFLSNHLRCVVLDEASYSSRNNELTAAGIRVEVVPEVFYELESLVCRNRDYYSSSYYFEKQARCVAFRMLKLNPSIVTIDGLLELKTSCVLQTIDIEYPHYSQDEKAGILTTIQDWKRDHDNERVSDILKVPPEKAILDATIPQASIPAKGGKRL